MMQIRSLSSPEIPQLAALARHIFLDTFVPTNNPQDVMDYAEEFLTVEHFSRDLKNSDYFTYGCFVENEMVGYIQMLINRFEVHDGIEFELKRFYLLADYHGKGYAKKMMEHCVSVAKQKGYEQMWLGVWEKNYKALKFYEKMGFRPISSHNFVMGQETQTDLIYALKF